VSDQVTVDNGGLTDFSVSTDDAGASGHVQRVKLAYSADGSATHVPADADGLLVNLGANNDVTITGTVTVGSITAGSNAIGKLAANDGVDIGDVSVNLITPGTADANLGKAEDGVHVSGSTGVMVLAIRSDAVGASSGTSGDYEPLHTDSEGKLRTNARITAPDGSEVQFSLPLPASVSPTMDAATYTAGDSLQDAAFSIADATTGAGRTCHLIGLRIIDKDDQGIDLDLYFFRTTIATTPAAQDPFTLDDTDSVKCVGFIDTDTDGVWKDLGGSRIWQMTRSPIPMLTTATTLYMLAKTQGTPTYTAGGLIFEPTLARD
jgi:hypothetical protein